MIFLQNLVILAVGILAAWKLHDIVFAKKNKKSLDRALVELSMFFAEFTYRTMNNLDNYESAPQEIYDWLTAKYLDWRRHKK